MVLKIEQILGSKNSLQILRLLTIKPYKYFGLTQISKLLNISKSNVSRILNILEKNSLLVPLGEKRKKIYKINAEHKLIKELYRLFSIEQQNSLAPEIKNSIDLLFDQIKDKVQIFIVFGSVAYNLETKDSDIDICIVGDKNIKGLRFNERKIEIHNYTLEEFKNLKDFVVIEALLNGIWYKGDVFNIISSLRSFPKSYMIYRLNKAKHFLKREKALKGEAKGYYAELAKITLGEIDSIIHNKTTLPRKLINLKVTDNALADIEKELSQCGDKIWIA